MTAERLRGHVTHQADHPDLPDCLFPVDREIGAIACEVEGEIPAGLRGQFVRNGPNQMFEPAGKYHTFGGDGMLHGVTFEEGRAVYRNRWIRTRGLKAEIALGRSVHPGLSELMNCPDESLIGDAGPPGGFAAGGLGRRQPPRGQAWSWRLEGSWGKKGLDVG